MLIIIFSGIALLLSFFIHVLWWRKKMPLNTTSTLLFIFFGTLIGAIFLFACYAKTLVRAQFPEVLQFLMLYSSCALVYIILYSAIEQQSPTLAIIDYINQHGENGCDNQSLNRYLNASQELEKRLMLMEQGKWITLTNQGWQLTKKGIRIAQIFEVAAIIFGLNKGG